MENADMSKAEGPSGDAPRFEGANPILRVENLTASIDYYVRVLGFKIEWEFTGLIACVSRDRVGIFLSEGDQGNPGSWVWIGVSDVERLHAELERRGAKVRQPPTNFPWALEMQVLDLDGNVLRLGSEPKKDQPVGEWLDMRGTRWRRNRDGSWTRVGTG
jgi:predicted enzyme related to lactoylglutathione lyase